jgi:hypothetical protein
MPEKAEGKISLRLLAVPHEGRNYAMAYTSEEILKLATDKPFFVLPPRVLFQNCVHDNFVLNANSPCWKLLPAEEVRMLLTLPPKGVVGSESQLIDALKEFLKQKVTVVRAWLKAQKSLTIVLVEAPVEGWDTTLREAKEVAKKVGMSATFIRVSDASAQDYISTQEPFYTR